MGWEMQLILGDCLERLKNIADGSVDMVLADLPYGTTNNKWDVKIDLNALWGEIRGAEGARMDWKANRKNTGKYAWYEIQKGAE